MKIQQNYNNIKRTIPSDVTLIAVSKKQPIEKIKALLELGHKDFGENYVQELLEKHEQLHNNQIIWHFIGHLQSNKAKKLLTVIPNITIHTLDSLKLAGQINKHAAQPIDCFIQINIDSEESKHGINPNQVQEFYSQLQELKNINCIGVMCIPSKNNTDAFKRMNDLKNQINPQLKLSMGMSADYQNAINHGATHVRIGTKLFGERSK